MQFNMVGSVYNSLQFKKLNTEWNIKKQNLPKSFEKEESQISQMLRESEETIKSNAIFYIDSKLKSGGELSPKELDFLKENAPQLYDQAIKIQRERTQYKKELEQCRTKQEVQDLNTRKLQTFVTEARGIANNANIPKEQKNALFDFLGKRMMGIIAEHGKFLQTDEYATLPDDDKEDKKDKDKNDIPKDKNYLKEFFEIVNKNYQEKEKINAANIDAVKSKISTKENDAQNNTDKKASANGSKTADIGDKTYTANGRISSKPTPTPKGKTSSKKISIKA